MTCTMKMYHVYLVFKIAYLTISFTNCFIFNQLSFNKTTYQTNNQVGATGFCVLKYQ